MSDTREAKLLKLLNEQVAQLAIAMKTTSDTINVITEHMGHLQATIEKVTKVVFK